MTYFCWLRNLFNSCFNIKLKSQIILLHVNKCPLWAQTAESKQMRAELLSLYSSIKISLFKHENKLGQWNCRHQDQFAATHVQLVFLLFAFYHPFRLGRYHPPCLSFRSTQILPRECLEIYFIGHVRAFQCQTFNFNVKRSTSNFQIQVSLPKFSHLIQSL